MAKLDHQNRTPVVEILPDGRKRVTRVFDALETLLKKDASVEDSLRLPWGTPDAEFTACRLVRQGSSERPSKESADRAPWIRVYEEVPETAEVQVGSDTEVRLEDGRRAIEQEFIQLSSGPYFAGTVGSTAGPNSTVLQGEQATDDGTLRRIKRTFVSTGILSQADSDSSNGKLLRRTLVYANTIPPTPFGYILIDQKTTPVGGLKVYTYTFAKGDGEISRSTNFNQSDDQGTTGITVIRVAHLTSPATLNSPISTPIGFVRVSDEMDERDGHRIWQATFAKGTGKVSENISPRQDGLREVTWVSLGARMAPAGIVIRDDWRIAEGFKVYVVGTIQTRTGGTNITSEETTFERFVPFTYPGRAKIFTEQFNGITMLDVFLSPPVTTDVKATVRVGYQTSNLLGTINNYWNPREWATLRSQWVGLGNNAQNDVRALTGYRAVSPASVQVQAGQIAPNNVSCRGQTVFGGTTAKITVAGGPAAPDGNTYVLDLTLEPAFTDTEGTVYYRRTEVSATIPAQSALPV